MGRRRAHRRLGAGAPKRMRRHFGVLRPPFSWQRQAVSAGGMRHGRLLRDLHKSNPPRVDAAVVGVAGGAGEPDNAKWQASHQTSEDLPTPTPNAHGLSLSPRLTHLYPRPFDPGTHAHESATSTLPPLEPNVSRAISVSVAHRLHSCGCLPKATGRPNFPKASSGTAQ